ncbi:MAG: hypothetical protein KTR30_31755 [Saprospiraceae bacterium]|nr:hypothetical protein [Saprospiraceae bacterium]
MKGTGRIIGINLIILAVYSIGSLAISTQDQSQYESMGYGFIMLILLAIHVAILLIVGIVFFVKKDKEKGKAFLISLCVVLLIGFSACLGGMEALESNLI